MRPWSGRLNFEALCRSTWAQCERRPPLASRGYKLAGVQQIRREPLRELVRVRVKQLILANHLRPGQSIVIDRLADELGVSHTPVREALAMLQHDGLVIMRPYGHPRVTEIDALAVRDVWEMRIVLEGWGALKAAETASENDINRLAKSLESAYRDARQSRYDAHLESDTLLHETMLQTADNKLFNHLAELVADRSMRIRWLVETTAPAEEVLMTIDEHFAILEALRAHDPTTTHERLMAHLQAGLKRTLTTLERMKETPN